MDCNIEGGAFAELKPFIFNALRRTEGSSSFDRICNSVAFLPAICNCLYIHFLISQFIVNRIFIVFYFMLMELKTPTLSDVARKRRRTLETHFLLINECFWCPKTLFCPVFLIPACLPHLILSLSLIRFHILLLW